MNDWIADYIEKQRAAHASIPVEQVAELIEIMAAAVRDDQQVFVFGNGGNAANASHFITDLGKSSSDALDRRFRCLSLNDNISWMTAIGNDYDYADVFKRQLENYANPGDVVMTMSVSGRSPNLVTAMQWAVEQGCETIAIVGAARGALGDIAKHVLVIDDTHYGRVEDVQMGICHLICYAFIENPEWGSVEKG